MLRNLQDDGDKEQPATPLAHSQLECMYITTKKI